MAHHNLNAAIFSPSVARIAASTAKDWNYVDSWLSLKFHGRAPPPFERNPDTLKALLALAALNEAADEDRDLVARAEASALHELGEETERKTLQQPQQEGPGDLPTSMSAVKDAILSAIEDGLTREGKSALDAVASTAVELGIAYPEPESLGRRMVQLQAQKFDLDQATERVAVLQRHIDSESAKMNLMLKSLEGDAYRPASDLAKQNLEIQRRIKAMAARLPELKNKASALATSVGFPSHTIEDIQTEEAAYLDVLTQRKNLEAQVQAFHGLPPDTASAREELESRRSELRSITQRRDAVFEGLVERETPRKRT